MITIEPVSFEDKNTVIDLLKNAALPTQNLPEGLPDFVIAKEGENATGIAGLESFGLSGLLRSVAVDPAYQGKGGAAKLVQTLLAQANSKRLEEIYLITTTADHYFDRFDFKAVDRDLVPGEIQKTQQFSGLCPSSAVVMKHVLKRIDQ